MNNRLAKVGFAVLALAAIAAPVGLLTNAQAQQPGLGQGNPPPAEFGGPRQGFPGGPGPQMGPGGGMMMGGQATMIDDNNNLYVLRGNTIYKISKGSMRIEGQTELPRPQMGMPGQPGQPGEFPRTGGGAPPRRGGGQGTPPPPSGQTGGK